MNPPNEWNAMEITLDGNHVQIAINGNASDGFLRPGRAGSGAEARMVPERGPRPTHGYMGLQKLPGYIRFALPPREPGLRYNSTPEPIPLLGILKSPGDPPL